MSDNGRIARLKAQVLWWRRLIASGMRRSAAIGEGANHDPGTRLRRWKFPRAVAVTVVVNFQGSWHQKTRHRGASWAKIQPQPRLISLVTHGAGRPIGRPGLL